jgi:hypothetical protein
VHRLDVRVARTGGRRTASVSASWVLVVNFCASIVGVPSSQVVRGSQLEVSSGSPALRAPHDQRGARLPPTRHGQVVTGAAQRGAASSSASWSSPSLA